VEGVGGEGGEEEEVLVGVSFGWMNVRWLFEDLRGR